MTELTLGLATLLVYAAVWQLWVRPRLLVLRQEAARLRYRVPQAWMAGYLLAAAVAPLTAFVVAVVWLVVGGRTIAHSWNMRNVVKRTL